MSCFETTELDFDFISLWVGFLKAYLLRAACIVGAVTKTAVFQDYYYIVPFFGFVFLSFDGLFIFQTYMSAPWVHTSAVPIRSAQITKDLTTAHVIARDIMEM